LRRKTLHRVMNELIEAWEEGAGVREFVILTAQANDAHLEALSTIRTGTASVVLLDVFGLDFGHLLTSPEPLAHGGELDTSLLLYLAPELVAVDLLSGPVQASAIKGEGLYKFILDRLTQRLFPP
jgi:creatinine amidohydrolase/Fe(II)-dependent formamide hydrolase-like protein